MTGNEYQALAARTMNKKLNPVGSQIYRNTNIFCFRSKSALATRKHRAFCHTLDASAGATKGGNSMKNAYALHLARKRWRGKWRPEVDLYPAQMKLKWEKES